jgi:hypothetical protein
VLGKTLRCGFATRGTLKRPGENKTGFMLAGFYGAGALQRHPRDPRLGQDAAIRTERQVNHSARGGCIHSDRRFNSPLEVPCLAYLSEFPQDLV